MPFTYKYIALNKKPPITKQNLCIFFLLEAELSVFDKVTLAIFQCKTKGKQIKVEDILNDTERQLVVNLDEGFYIFRTVRNSPAYFDRKKKDTFAMIRQLGFQHCLFLNQQLKQSGLNYFQH